MKESLRYFVRCVYSDLATYHTDAGNSAVYFCADQLEIWPDRDSILSEFKDYLSEHRFAYDGAKLLGAWIGINDFRSQISSIFDKVYSVTVLGVKTDPLPMDPLIKRVFHLSDAKSLKAWQEMKFKFEFEKSLALLPMAIRASNGCSNEFVTKLLNIIRWSIEKVSKKEYRSEVLLESVTQCILRLAKLANACPKLQIVDEFLKSGLFRDIFYLVQKGLDFEQKGLVLGRLYYMDSIGYSKGKLRSAFNYFCGSIPKKYVPRLLLLTQELFAESVTQSLSDEKVYLEVSFDTILHLCRRATDSAVSEFLQFLTSVRIPAKKNRGKNPILLLGGKNPILLLIEKIKFAKGRRFLNCFDQGQ